MADNKYRNINSLIKGFAMLSVWMKRLFSPNMLIALAFFCAALGATPQEASCKITAEYDGELLTLEADNAPLGQVLDAVGQATGIRFVLLGPANVKVSIERTTDILEEILKTKLLPHVGGIAVHGEGTFELASGMPLAIYIVSKGKEPPPLTSLRLYQTQYGMSSSPHETEVVTSLFMQESLSQADLDLLERELFQSQDTVARHAALDVLASVPDETGRGIQLLARAAQDSDLSVRLTAINALGFWGGDQALEVLKAAYQDNNLEVRQTVLFAAAMMEPEALISLAAPALKDSDPQIRLAAVDALGNSLYMDPTIKSLLMTASEDSDPTIREVVEYFLTMPDDSGELWPEDEHVN